MNETRHPAQEIKTPPAQMAYADTLFYGGAAGFVVMLVTYALYVGGILEPQVPLDELTRLWSGSAKEYLAASGIPTGWGWLALVGKGDLCNFIGIVVLAGLTVVCFIQLAVNLIRTRQWIMAGIAMLEVLVLTLAASGVLVGGGH